MFNSDFNDISTSQIVQELKTKGYFAFEQALTQTYIEELLQQIDFNQVLVNSNNVGVVLAKNIKFLTHCLANSKKTYDVITSRKVLDICKGYFDDDYKLTNHRVYQTSHFSHMPWHTDNNRQIGKKLDSKHNMPGLLFLFYLSDVDRNAFQYIKDSHTWSEKYSHEVYLSDRFIENNHHKDIISFPMRKGSIIVCSTHGVHRAEPFKDKNYGRTSLLFQVDEVGSDNIGHGEKNLINTEFIDNASQEIMDYLGFGFRRDYPAFPNSSITTMTPQDLLKLQRQLFLKTTQALLKSFITTMLPGEAVINAKRMIWRFKSK